MIDLPDIFPARDFSNFMAAAREVLLFPHKSEEWKEFAGASNLIGWRFRSSFEDMKTYIDSWQNSGYRASAEEIYLRERALYGMFSCGVSCIESTCYACHALASHPSVLGLTFGEKEQRHSTPTRFKKALGTHSRSQALVTALVNLTTSDEWKLWVDLRNRMTHRSNLPRIINLTGGSEPPLAKALHFAPTSSTDSFEGDENYLEALFFWLSNSLGQILAGGQRLAIGS